MKVYYHPKDNLDMMRVKREFCDAVFVAGKDGWTRPMRGVLLDSEMEPPYRRAGCNGSVYVTGEYNFDGFVEINCDERAIGQYEIDGENGRRRWCVPAELLNSELRIARILNPCL